MTLPTLIGRLLSLLIAAAYLVVAYCAGGWTFDLYVVGGKLLFILSLIWFPEHWGEYMGPLGLLARGHVTCETPAALVAAAGWFLLVGVPVIIWFLSAGM
jgi:hypothetical protein